MEVILKGLVVGSSMSIPGVSGGTMAILLGIYNRLISAISNFTKDAKGNLLFLGKFCLGAALGIGTLSFALKWLLEVVPLPVAFFFLGVVVGGLPALYKETKQSRFRVSSALFILLGLVVVVGIGFIPTGMLSFSSITDFQSVIMCLVAGIVIAIALILPGISTSHMLIVLGMYQATLTAITEFDIPFLALLVVSTLIGIVLTTKPLAWLMERFPHQTYCIIMGFVIGSVTEIFTGIILPAVPASADVLWWVTTVIAAVLAFVLGLFGILWVARVSNHGE